MERCLSLWIYEWLGKIQWNIITWRRKFYSWLNIEDISDADYAHAKRVWKDHEIKNLEEYYDLYVQSDTLLFADIFENFINMCLKIYELDRAKFLSVPGLAWQVTF